MAPTVDLNLLTVLDALLQEGSVTGAARRLHLTPPGVSRSLQRLRRITGDPLFVRMGRNLVPTPTADALRDRAHSVLEDAHALLAQRADLTDAELERTLRQTFTVQAAADAAELFGPAMLRVIRSRTTAVRLRLLDDEPSAAEGRSGSRVGLRIGYPVLTPDEDLHHERLLTDRMVLVGRRDGMLARTPPGEALSAADIVLAPHVAASRHGEHQAALDAHLESAGLIRDVVASTPGYTAAFTMLRDADLLCLAPEGITRTMRGDDLITRPLAAPLAPVFIVMSWHRRTHADPAHRWLRDRVREAALSTCPDARRRAEHQAEHLST